MSDLCTWEWAFYEGGIGIFGCAVLDIFWSVFRFLCQKTSVFRFWCSMRFADFSIFSIWFSVFVKNTAVFRFWYPMWFCGFSYLDLFEYTVLYAVFRFWMNFSSVLRFLLYPNAPLLKDSQAEFFPSWLYYPEYRKPSDTNVKASLRPT